MDLKRTTSWHVTLCCSVSYCWAEPTLCTFKVDTPVLLCHLKVEHKKNNFWVIHFKWNVIPSPWSHVKHKAQWLEESGAPSGGPLWPHKGCWFFFFLVFTSEFFIWFCFRVHLNRSKLFLVSFIFLVSCWKPLRRHTSSCLFIQINNDLSDDTGHQSAVQWGRGICHSTPWRLRRESLTLNLLPLRFHTYCILLTCFYIFKNKNMNVSRADKPWSLNIYHPFSL